MPYKGAQSFAPSFSCVWLASLNWVLGSHDRCYTCLPENPFCHCPFLLLVSSSITPCLGFSGVREEDERNRGGDLYQEILRDEAVARLHQLGKVSDGDGYLERIFMSPAAVRAGNLIREWIEDAGLRT
ncbi:allantoate deiminase 2-like [Rosa chinensis]|uniref:allantoate deiminase 2-like n=1 Tax=Rosa chinensis TaxID=74649 RepID=UPI001AD8E52D|nr:allantoate deiminase 2-like [Rosa chinensis]